MQSFFGSNCDILRDSLSLYDLLRNKLRPILMLIQQPSNRKIEIFSCSWYSHMQRITQSMVINELLQHSIITMILIEALFLSVPFSPLEFLVLSLQNHYWLVSVLLSSLEILVVSREENKVMAFVR